MAVIQRAATRLLAETPGALDLTPARRDQQARLRRLHDELIAEGAQSELHYAAVSERAASWPA